ncbi:methyl-accepting chemotaxis protein [Azospirillum canadense]|uniref:methyl-accepting chemotaxis protein n=1 Tax=Azospirillum canadense TaxID=403962 RepID=UPI0022265A0C|nr:methyl-accepting chemotaxis protein [Azospirillum canadense]MCW2239546.1 methyl-accepting chemotaxis protein [Azospirillum canadense]
MRQSLTTVMTASVGAIGLLLCSVLGYAIVDAASDWGHSQRAKELTAADRAAFDRMKKIRLRRGDVQNLLLASDTPRGALETVHKDSEADMRAVVEAIAGARLPDGPQLGREIESRWSAIASTYQAILTEADRPKTQRDIKNTDAWYKAMGGVIDAIAAASLAMANETRMQSPRIAEMILVRQAAWDARDFTGRECSQVRGNVVTSKPLSTDQLRAFAANRGGADLSWNKLKDLLSRPGAPMAVRGLLETAYTSVMANRAAQDAVLAKFDGSGQPAMAADAWNKLCTSSLGPLMEIGARALDEVGRLADEDVAEARTRLLIASGLLLAAVLITGWTAVFLVRRFRRPIGALTHAVDQLTRKNYTAPVPSTGYEDELGRMSLALEQLRRQALHSQELEAEQAAAAEARERRREALEAAVADFQAVVGAVLLALGTASSTMAQTSHAMSGTAEHTSGQANNAAAASEQTSSNVQTVAAATEELAASIQEIGRQVTTSTTISARAVEDARRIDGLVSTLADTAQQIDTVVGLINSIAGQTNLLALNATIEAARAGEAGKGFAVVASEVKALATQTGRATEEIQAKVSEIQGATTGAAEAMQGIAATIGQLNEIATAIAAAIEEQGAATQEIADNVQQAARGTQEVSDNIATLRQAAGQTGSAAGQVTDAAGRVTAETDRLRGEVERFLGAIRTA